MTTPESRGLTKSLSASWRAVARWISYVVVDAIEPGAVRVTARVGGLSIEGDAFSRGYTVNVGVDNFAALERSILAHNPDVPYAFKQGAAWTYVPPRYFRMLTREVRHALAAWRSAR